MPKDNNITNSDEQNAVTNQEAESQKNNIPGDDAVKNSGIASSNTNKEFQKKNERDLTDQPEPN